jgi:hypothetical protein
VDELDLVSLLLVVGSAVAVVVLGMLIYYGMPSSKKSAVPQHVPFAPAASPPISLVSTVKLTDEKKKEAPRQQPILAPVLVEQLVEVSEAPPPFSEDPIVPRRRKTVRSALPTDTTALKGFSSEAASSRVLVISAPKRKVKAYRNATSPAMITPRKRRSESRTLATPSASEPPTEQKNSSPDQSATSEGFSS